MSVKNRHLGITLRTALLSWLVTLVTLSIFVIAIIPQQKRTFLENLHSKARGAAASLQGVAAGAAVNEDYSSVVDHCLGMMDGDKSIDFLVITKNDGISQVCQQENPRWRQENLNAYWRPSARQSGYGIDLTPLFNRRVFRYSQPFDYSGIQWGWIHVGLSLESYDQSVKAVYFRTGILAVVCTLFSLAASAVYAKRMVKPVLNLRSVVLKVAAGDLSARAEVHGMDELGSLAISVNAMTEALLHRDRILQSVRFSAQEFLSPTRWQETVQDVLAKIGAATEVSRIHIYENKFDEPGPAHTDLSHEWTGPGASKIMSQDNASKETLSGVDFGDWLALLKDKKMIAAHYRELTETQRHAIGRDDFKSLLVIPIMVEERWWGLLTLAECHYERNWSDAEQDCLKAVAEMLGAAIARQKIQDKLIEAKYTLEQRVQERTQELQHQMAAKQKAHADLAEAQQNLIETSRQAGMAEVATSVLHNVGNVLNSVNVSCTLSIDRLRQSKLANLPKVTAMLDGQNGKLGEFLTQDPKGKQIPGYLSSLAPVLVEEQTSVLQELYSLRDKIDHIKEIVAMQQSYAKVSGVTETMPVQQLVEDALKLNLGALARHEIRLERQFEELPPARLEKHKILQILLNLIRNAKHALEDSGVDSRMMTVRVFSPRPDRAAIQVIDNGVGIPPENLTKIFGHGFTTRKSGHGFGLHSGALAAKELGGSLAAESAGLGKGATFTLELPLNRSTTL